MNILLAHGSSDSRHAEQAKALAMQASEILSEKIELFFLNSEALPDGAYVLPLLLGEGWHARNDIARLSEASNCVMLPPLSSHAIAVACMAGDLAKEALSGDCSVIFALYHFEGFETLMHALDGMRARFPEMERVDMYASPNITESLAQWQIDGVMDIVVQPMIMFEGKTMEHIRRQVAESESSALMGPVLSSHAAFPAFIADCFRSRC